MLHHQLHEVVQKALDPRRWGCETRVTFIVIAVVLVRGVPVFQDSQFVSKLQLSSLFGRSLVRQTCATI